MVFDETAYYYSSSPKKASFEMDEPIKQPTVVTTHVEEPVKEEESEDDEEKDPLSYFSDLPVFTGEEVVDNTPPVAEVKYNTHNFEFTLKKMSTWELVPPPEGQKIVGSN